MKCHMGFLDWLTLLGIAAWVWGPVGPWILVLALVLGAIYGWWWFLGPP